MALKWLYGRSEYDECGDLDYSADKYDEDTYDQDNDFLHRECDDIDRINDKLMTD